MNLEQVVITMQLRLQKLEDDCAGCPGSMEPQDFALDKFPLDPCPKRRRSDNESSPGEST